MHLTPYPDDEIIQMVCTLAHELDKSVFEVMLAYNFPPEMIQYFAAQ